MRLRPEEPQDFAALRELHRRAFAPGDYEADVVEALRAADAHVPELCLVAISDDDAILGHVMISHALVDVYFAFALGPIAVDPAHQNQGIGSALMREVIGRASCRERV